MADLGLGTLMTGAFTLIVVAVGLGVGLQVLTDVRDDMTTDSVEYNATNEGVDALVKIPTKLGIIVTVMIAGVMLFMIVRYLAVRYG